MKDIIQAVIILLIIFALIMAVAILGVRHGRNKEAAQVLRVKARCRPSWTRTATQCYELAVTLRGEKVICMPATIGAVVAGHLRAAYDSARVRRLRETGLVPVLQSPTAYYGKSQNSYPATRADDLSGMCAVQCNRAQPVHPDQGGGITVRVGNPAGSAKRHICLYMKSARVRCARTHAHILEPPKPNIRDTASAAGEPVVGPATRADDLGSPKMSAPLWPGATPLELAVCAAPATRADILWKAICQVESGGDPNAYNEREGAAGIAQIREILVRDVNRIVGHERFSLPDRWDVGQSYELFRIYQYHYSRGQTDEETARMWNGGPRGMSKASTLPYWRNVQQAMEDER